MGIDASIALQGKPVQIDNPLNYLLQAQQLQAGQNQNALFPLQQQEQQLKLMQAQRMNDLVSNVLSRRGGQQPAPMGAQGGNALSAPSAPANGGGNALSQSGPPADDGIPYSLADLADLATVGYPGAKEMLEVKKAAMQGVSFKPGETSIVGGRTFTTPILDKGMQMGQDGVVRAIPGYSATNASIQGAQTAAQEGVKLLPLGYKSPDGRPIGGTVDGYTGASPAQPAPAQLPVPVPTGAGLNHMTPEQSAALMAQAKAQFGLQPHPAQSGGYVAPTTGTDGQPVPPQVQAMLTSVAQSRDPAQLQQFVAHVTQQINGAIPEGPQRQAAMQKLQSEAQTITQSWAPAARAPAPGRPQLQSDTEAAQQAANVQLQTKPQLDMRTKEYGDMADYGKALNGHLSDSQALLQRIGQSREALTKFQAGGGGEMRSQLATWAQAVPGMPTKLVDRIAGGDLSASQEFQKYAAQEALGTMQQALASDTGKGSQGNRVAMQLFIKNNPNIDTDPRAIEKIFNFQTQLHNQLKAQADAYQAYKSVPGNDPTAFPNYWASETIKRGFVTPEIKSGYAKGVAVPPNVQAVLEKYK